MATGKSSPIVEAIAAAERGTTGEIRVHLSKRWFEKDAFGRASRLFEEFGMRKTAHRNAVLLYVNLRKKKFAIIGDEGVHREVGQQFWESVCRELHENLHATHYERAIAMTVNRIGETLQRYFPVEEGVANHDELSNEVTLD